ncbi:MAG: isoprenylcysteine carboxylmethyltransferase family protein [Thermodesulfobacteriota bacterium]
MNRTAVKTLIFTVVVPGTAAGLIPLLVWMDAGGIRETAHPLVQAAGWAVLGLGLVLYALCAWDFTVSGKGTPLPLDAPRFLVERRLYKHLRNPMYVGVLSIILGVAFLADSALLFLYAALLFCLFHCFTVFYEEPALARKFGESYLEYCRSVPRWVPAFINGVAGKAPQER